MKHLAKTIIYCVLLAALSACQPAADQALPTAPNPVSGPTPERSMCSDALWPFATGAEWEFRDVATGATYTLTSEVQAEEVILTLNGNTSTLPCTEQGIRGVYPAFLGSGHPGLGNAFNGEVTEGVLLPAILPAGFWDQVVAAGGSLTLPLEGEPTAYEVEGGRVVSLHTTQPPQTVNVTAGTFEVTPVREDVLYEVSVRDSVLGAQRDVLINVGVVWAFADEVGPVRITFEGGEVSTAEGRWPLPGGITLELVVVRFP